ncbi:hypothetical protein [Streptomyces sp. DB-54]
MRPALLLAMGPGIAERLLGESQRVRLARLARTDLGVLSGEVVDG